MDKDKLYKDIDADKEMTDEEKRETYFSEIDNAEADERCEDRQQ